MFYRKLPNTVRLILFLLSFTTTILSDRNALIDDGSIAHSGSRIAQWTPSSDDSWNYWWSYSGVSGPAYWGVLNLDWFMCDKGAKQSPINIETKNLIYDPHMKALKVDNNLISGVLYNDGHAIVFNCSTTALIFAQQSPNIKATAKQQQKQFLDQGDQKISLNNDNNNSISITVKKKRSSTLLSNNFPNDNSLKFGLFSSYNNDNLKTSETLNDLSKTVDLSIRQSGQVSSSLSLLSEESNENAGDVNEKLALDSNENNNEEEQQQQVNSFEDYDKLQRIQISGAGLVYPYRFEAIYLRFGNGLLSQEDGVVDSTATSISPFGGSEHRINSKSFSGELQLIAYNSLLYKSYFEASSRPNGLLGIAILLDIKESKKDDNNKQQQKPSSSLSSIENITENINGDGPLEMLLRQAGNIRYRDESVIIRNFNLSALLPDLEHFVSYDGSLTTPGCHESVNWLILNKPLYITQSNLNVLRSISADERTGASTGTIIANNIRPIQATNNRPIRTNIRPTVGNNNQNPETCQRLWTKYQYKESTTKTS